MNSRILLLVDTDKSPRRGWKIHGWYRPIAWKVGTTISSLVNCKRPFVSISPILRTCLLIQNLTVTLNQESFKMASNALTIEQLLLKLQDWDRLRQKAEKRAQDEQKIRETQNRGLWMSKGFASQEAERKLQDVEDKARGLSRPFPLAYRFLKSTDPISIPDRPG